MKTITESEFWAQYKPIKNHLHEGQGFDDCLFETYGEDLSHVKETLPDFIWTVIEGDEGMSIVSGYHYVNRFGYLITEMPCDQDFIDVILEDLTDDLEDEYDDNDDNIMGA